MITAVDKLLTPADVVALQFRRRNRVLRDVNSPIQQAMLNADRDASKLYSRHLNNVELGYHSIRRRVRILIQNRTEAGTDLNTSAIY